MALSAGEAVIENGWLPFCMSGLLTTVNVQFGVTGLWKPAAWLSEEVL